MEKTADDILNDVDDDFELAPLSPTLQDLINKRSLKWIFVGGKGGVGKTTSSCSLATLLSKHRKNVLIISTDPAHNLSDAFGQKFGKTPTLVEGFPNLFAMEIDPSKEADEKELFPEETMGFIKDLATSIPGIDEAMAFAEVMKLVQNLQFETIVFDTAPTGHTLRLLSFPSVMEKGLGHIMSLKNKFSGIFNQFQAMMGGGQGGGEDMQDRLESTKQIIEEVDKQFKNPDLTTFVCVCIPEFLSVYETERLVQELTKFKIDVDNIIVNQVLYPEKSSSCDFCWARVKMQQKYLNQIADLYEDFHVLKMPMLKHEIRGKAQLEDFAKFLLSPYDEEYAKKK